MAHLLHIDSSLFTEMSVTREITRTFREVWAAEHPDGPVTYRDLRANPVEPLVEAAVLGSLTPEPQRTPEQKSAMLARRTLVDEVVNADAYLFGVPMYNWGVAAAFKTWLDQIIEHGRTLGPGSGSDSDSDASNGSSSTPDSDMPLAGRPATVVLSYGGGYLPGSPKEDWDHVRPYLETVLVKALGLDVVFVTAQLGVALIKPELAELAPQARQLRAQAHEAARARAKEVAARFKPATV